MNLIVKSQGKGVFQTDFFFIQYIVGNNWNFLFRRGAVKMIDGLYWSVYWLEGLEDYNSK